LNLVTETKRRLDYLNKELDDLNNSLNLNVFTISFLAKEHINNEIAKTEKNIQYYSEILEKLEDEK
jgi:RecJ-like exonuclease